MAYTLNAFFRLNITSNAPRVLVYPNNTVAAQLVNHLKGNGSRVIHIADCIPDSTMRLPMPNVLMSAADAKIRMLDCRVTVVGVDVYLALLETEGVTIFMAELRKRLDSGIINADYLISSNNKLDFASRYEESRKAIFIKGDEETLEPFHVLAYSDKWANPSDTIGYKDFLRQVGQFVPSGTHSLMLSCTPIEQAGLSRAVSFVSDIHDIATQRYGISSDSGLDDKTLECLLSSESIKNGQTPETFLTCRFGENNCNVRLALKKLLELQHDSLWPAYVWFVKRHLPGNSYIARVLSEDVTADKLLWKYAVGTAITVLSDANAHQFSVERAEALKNITNYESLVIEFIGLTRECSNALPFLNCGTLSERIEIVRRASLEDLSHGLPRQYGELFPTLSDYLSSSFNYDCGDIAAYFSEYRRLKVADILTDEFVNMAFDMSKPCTCPSRDSVLEQYRGQSDTALLVVDGMGAEYIPLLMSMAKRYGMNIESCIAATANIPTETELNPIRWDAARIIPEVKQIDSIVHDGAAKHEICTPERNFVETLNVFEADIMNHIADGLSRFSRVVVTADHGASRLAVIARRESKSKTLPWDKQRDGEPLDWRYSTAPEGIQRPDEYESQYSPESGKTYWVVRGYNRLPKTGGKVYGLHGGASLEERLVPVMVFTKNAMPVAPVKTDRKPASDLEDGLAGLI